MDVPISPTESDIKAAQTATDLKKDMKDLLTSTDTTDQPLVGHKRRLPADGEENRVKKSTTAKDPADPEPPTTSSSSELAHPSTKDIKEEEEEEAEAQF